MTMTEAIRTAYSVPLGLSNKSIIKERDTSRAAMFFKLLSPRLWTFSFFSITYLVYDTLYCTGITKRLTVRFLKGMTQPLFICSKKGRLFEGRGVEEGEEGGEGVVKLFKDSYFSSEYGICLESYNILNNIIFT